MPLICVPRYVIAESYKTGGTQYVDGSLAFSGPTTIVLSEAIFGETGDYILFSYGAFPTPAQLSNVTVNTDGLILSGTATLENDSANSRVILHLFSRATNGKQFVDGDLNFAGPTTAILNSTLYATPGTYELFEVTGTVTGLTNLTCVSAKGLTASAPTKSGNIIYVTLA